MTNLWRSRGLLTLFMLTANVACAESVSVVFQSTDTPPYWSPSLPDNGRSGTLLRLISAAAGVKYVFEYLPVKRFRISQQPYLVGDPAILLSLEHRAIFPIDIFQSAFFFYTPRHHAIELGKLSNFRGLTLGVLRGTIEDKAYFVRNGIKVEESDSIESLLKKLKRGRIDFSILVEASGQYAIGKIFPDEVDHFAQLDIPGTVRPIALMIDTSTPEGLAVARHYRKVFAGMLRSRKYRAALIGFYEQGHTNDVYGQLNRFVNDYQSTWDK